MAWGICMDSVCKHQVCETRLFEEEQKWQESRQKLRDSCGGESQQHNHCLLILGGCSIIYSEKEGTLFTFRDFCSLIRKQEVVESK